MTSATSALSLFMPDDETRRLRGLIWAAKDGDGGSRQVIWRAGRIRHRRSPRCTLGSGRSRSVGA